MANIPLSDGEWKLMNQLWGKSPATITQLTERLAPETGWTKHTIITMLSRLEKKGAVAHRENGRAKEFWLCWIRRMPAAGRPGVFWTGSMAGAWG